MHALKNGDKYFVPNSWAFIINMLPHDGEFAQKIT